MQYNKFLTHTSSLQFLACLDQLPSGYGLPCTYTCEQLASEGQCSWNWSAKLTCFAGPPDKMSTHGKVRDDCKLSCGNCRKQHILFLTLNGIKLLISTTFDQFLT